MILIEQIYSDGLNFRFYNGVEFDALINHAKDGSEGFIFCFVDSYIKEVKSYNRNNKLKSIIEDKTYSKFKWESINNDFIAIYQTDGIGIDILYKCIRERVINNNIPKSPYLHVTEMDDKGTIKSGGAWKVEMSKNYN